ncbi:MAG: HEAT repeat domain-containing protein [Candidatus Omnitrophota bacterium]|nr:MAG: HEAT repeat domain-containing protein [Candidatus Omnitrophota bacterium]
MRSVKVKRIFLTIALLVILSWVTSFVYHFIIFIHARNTLRKIFIEGVLTEIDQIDLLHKKGIPATSLLIGLLKDDNDLVKINAMVLLAEFESHEAAPSLAKLLKSDNWRVRFFASHALGRISDKGTVDSLAKAWLEENDLRVAREIAIAVGKIGDKKAAPAFIKTYKDKDEKIKILSSLILYKLLSKEGYFNDIKEAIHNKDDKLRLMTVWTLGEIEDQRIIPLLEEALVDSNQKVREFAQKSIEKINSKVSNNNTRKSDEIEIRKQDINFLNK